MKKRTDGKCINDVLLGKTINQTKNISRHLSY